MAFSKKTHCTDLRYAQKKRNKNLILRLWCHTAESSNGTIKSGLHWLRKKNKEMINWNVCIHVCICRKFSRVFSVVGSGRRALGPRRTRSGPSQAVKVFRRCGRVLRRCTLTYVDSAGIFSNGVDYRGATVKEVITAVRHVNLKNQKSTLKIFCLAVFSF